jgi:hypothetical protein
MGRENLVKPPPSPVAFVIPLVSSGGWFYSPNLRVVELLVPPDA